MKPSATRREFLGTAGAAVALSGVSLCAAEPQKRPKVAAIFTEFTYRSHAHVILENFLEPYPFNGKRTEPGVEVVSFFADQTPKGHMTEDVAREYKIPVFETIDEALCLGGKELAVDAVLSIGEHGKYPRNKLGQTEYAGLLKVGRSSTRWNFACALKGEAKPRATRFHVGPWQNRNLFKALAHAIQHHVRTGKAPYPVERTLLVSGVLDAAMHARAEGKALKTPHLEFAYAARDFTAMRETGASWKVVTETTPQPAGIDPTGRTLEKK